MRRRHEILDSAALGRPVHVWCFGSWGAPVLVFPTAAGFAHEWDRQGMVEVLAPLLYGGKIKLYCPESNVSEAWTKRDADGAWKIQRHLAYERFVLEELVPWIRRDCGDKPFRIAVAGASLGAMYAATFALKHPETFHYALCLSGRYDSSPFLEGFSSLDTYLANPLAFVPGLEGDELERVRANTRLTLVCGRGKWENNCIQETEALADVLEAKGIPSTRDIWGHDVSHDWVWWKRQALMHLGRTFG